MGQPRKVPPSIIAKVVIDSRRRCCLCVYLDNDESIQRGQIAHINSRCDNKETNLVFLCLKHHDEFDSRTSQSKGITVEEVRHYRDLLYQKYADSAFDKSALDQNMDDERVWLRFRCEGGHESWQQLWEFKAFHEWLTDRSDITKGMAIWGICPIHAHGIDGSILELKIREA